MPKTEPDDRWWDAWPAAHTTDEEIDAIVDEEGEAIAKELLTHIRDTRRDEAVEAETKETAA